MCGIAGFITPPGQTADPELLRRMAQTMILRGPDGEGIYTDGSVGFAHRRLSVIDLEGGAQPMSSADGSLVVVFNGEIFNFLELRKELELTLVKDGVEISETVKYSFETYVKKKLQSSADENFKALLEKTMIYSDSAKDYFANNSK